MSIEKKYQVFVSSTYTDLLEERQEIMQALLELDCIPAGMELFPAANEDQWSLIKGVIDDCDYYVVVIGGRYGSIGPDGLSYTEMEYRYAIETGKPVIAFLHKDPESISKKHSEKTEEGLKKLEEFKTLVQKKMCKFWSTPQELGSVVSRSLISLQRKNPGIGWVRGNLIPSKDASLEILALKKEIESYQEKLSEARTQAPVGSESFSQGSDLIEIHYSFEYGERSYGADAYEGTFNISWDEIFYVVSPLMIDEISNRGLKTALDNFVSNNRHPELIKQKKFKELNIYRISMVSDDFQTIKVQLRALGLMNKSEKSRSVKDTGTYWGLTLYGDEIMTKLRAIKK
jgi:hypothetical protein